MHRQNPGKHEAHNELTELKVAVRKISELSTRISNLASRKRHQNAELLGSERETEKEIEERVQRFSEALTEFLVLRKRLRARYSAFENSLKNLEGATEANEVSTLAGFSVLSSQKEYRLIIDKIMENNLETIIPEMSEIERVVKLASEANDFGKWMGDMIDYDHATGDDDFTRMIVAIRDRNITRFNEIYEKIEKRIETEERKQI